MVSLSEVYNLQAYIYNQNKIRAQNGPTNFEYKLHLLCSGVFDAGQYDVLIS
jgi:hypothetical protein